MIVDIRARPSAGDDTPDEAGLARAFTYSIPERLAADICVGSYVLVPFGSQRLPGFVIGFTTERPPARLRDIISLLLDGPVFGEQEAELARWLADYHLCSLPDALRLLLPPGGARKAVRYLTCTPDGAEALARGALGRSPRQAQVLACLQAGPVEFDSLCRRLQSGAERSSRSTISSAIDGLERNGYVTQNRELQRPAASELVRQFAYLGDPDDEWESILAGLAERAPRQAEIIEELMAADGGPIPVAELNRSAVTTLAKKGLVRIEEKALRRNPYEEAWSDAGEEFLTLTDDQQTVLGRIREGLEKGAFREILLRGVTGSGKTEVYLHAIRDVLERGKTAIVLVPEISLTPQMVGRFRARFGDSLALLHSALSVGERFDEWQRAARGDARIVIGARSAVFAPVRDIGIIIIDEEYDSAYKQDSSPRYNAIDVARRRAAASNAVLVLGSATPSIERFYAAKLGRDVELAELLYRIDDRPMPAVRTIDLRKQALSGATGTLSRPLLDAIEARLSAGEQTMLFLNRRGFSTFVLCKECGHAPRCPNCAVSLTHHLREDTLKCHHCDYRTPVPEKCPECGADDVSFLGLGTERAADQVGRLFPDARVLRMDRDTTTTKGAYTKILGAFARGEADILIGTQMIATGHDFPNVTLVGVLSADTGLHQSDFRAAETTFQLLTQVSGRPGRAHKPGEVLVQTYNPDHYAILAAARHDFPAFYAMELEQRRQALYPPFVSMVRLVITCDDQSTGWAEAERLGVALQQQGLYHTELDAPPSRERLHFLGPAECALRKLRGRWRFSLLVKGPDRDAVTSAVRTALARYQAPENVTLVVDVEPLSMM